MVEVNANKRGTKKYMAESIFSNFFAASLFEFIRTQLNKLLLCCYIIYIEFFFFAKLLLSIQILLIYLKEKKR